VPRALRRALVAVALLAVLGLLAVGASALLDRPATVMTTSSTVPGPKQEVWETLTDLEGYGEWNPVITSASGELREGSELDLRVELPGHEPEDVEASVLIYRPERKLRWQERLVLPGLEDWEYEFILQPLAGDRVVVSQHLRIEGLLSPFADEDAAREALHLMAEALGERLAGGSGR
jgi:hypothetical protein